MTYKYETMVYRKFKDRVKKGLDGVLQETLPSGGTKQEIKEWTPEVLVLLQKACNEVIREWTKITKEESEG